MGIQPLDCPECGSREVEEDDPRDGECTCRDCDYEGMWREFEEASR